MAPVIIFAFNRLDALINVITSLLLGTFIKYYKISQLIHTQIIAN